jgi:hypothetical protein
VLLIRLGFYACITGTNRFTKTQLRYSKPLGSSSLTATFSPNSSPSPKHVGFLANRRSSSLRRDGQSRDRSNVDR